MGFFDWIKRKKPQEEEDMHDERDIPFAAHYEWNDAGQEREKNRRPHGKTTHGSWQERVGRAAEPDPQLDPLREQARFCFEQLVQLAQDQRIYHEQFFALEWPRHQQPTAEHCLNVGVRWAELQQEMQRNATQAQKARAAQYIHHWQRLDHEYGRIVQERGREIWERACAHQVQHAPDHDKDREIGFDR